MKGILTLFELLYTDERMIILSKKKIKIYSISTSDFVYVEEYFIDNIPYYLLRKKVIKALYSDNMIEIFVK